MKSTKPKRELDWFDNVENIRPLRSGRTAAALALAAAGPSVTVPEAKTKFEEEFEASESDTDPLAKMFAYVRWFEGVFPSGRVDVLQPMLYRILTRYGTDPRYRNDERTMKLWLLLADNFPERGFAVMELACNRGSCKELAKFYTFWSKMYEYAEQMNRAREILRRGIANRAIPLPDLYNALDELEVRICKWTMDREKRQMELDLADDDDIEFGERQPMNRLRVEPTRQGFRAPSVRTDSETPQRIRFPQKKPDFDIFVEDDAPILGNSNFNVPTVEDELKKDPDFQSIFGYKDNPSLHLDITENRARSGIKRVVPELAPKKDVPLASFSVYCEEQKAEKLKLKFAIRRELVETMSIEEGMLREFEKRGVLRPTEASSCAA